MPTQALTLHRSAAGYWRTQWYDDQGRRHTQSFGRQRTSACQQFAEFHASWRAEPAVRNPGSDRLTVRAAWEAFRRHADSYYRRADGTPTGQAANLAAAFAAALELYGDRPAATFGPSCLEACQRAMVETGLCCNVINQRVNQIRHVFRWLVSREMIPAACWHGLQAVSPIRPGRGVEVGGQTLMPAVSSPVGPVPEDHVWAVCQPLPPSLRAMVEFQMWTGCRPGEVCSLTTGAIDTRGKVWIFSPSRHKTAHHGKTRLVLIGPRARAAIEPFLRADLAAPMFWPAQAVNERLGRRVSDYTPPPTAAGDYRSWPSYRRRAKVRRPRALQATWTANNYARAIRRACIAAGVPAWSPNQLRHNAATRLRREFGLDVAQVCLGHSTADVTQVYAELDLAKAQAAMLRIG
jgi:integrase